MKKILMLTVVALVAATLTGCCSCRTPATGKNKNLIYYVTFFGLSLESAVCGDGFVVNGMSNK